MDPFSPTTTMPSNLTTNANITTPTAAILSPTTVPSTFSQPAAATTNSANNITAEQLRQRQEELDRKAAELAAREAELHRAQRINVRENNFPPLPSFLPFKPCFYQDINVEIEINFQSIVQKVYQLWMCKYLF